MIMAMRRDFCRCMGVAVGCQAFSLRPYIVPAIMRAVGCGCSMSSILLLIVKEFAGTHDLVLSAQNHLCVWLRPLNGANYRFAGEEELRSSPLCADSAGTLGKTFDVLCCLWFKSFNWFTRPVLALVLVCNPRGR